MGQNTSAITKLRDPAYELTYTDEAKRLEPGESEDDFDASKFILNHQESLNLQKYLRHGSTYPKTLDEAREIYRSDKLVDNGYMDRNHYELIMTTFVDVHGHTEYFMLNTLNTIQDWSGAIGVYSKTAVRFFGYAHQTLSELQDKINQGGITDAQIAAAKKDLLNLIAELHTHTDKMVQSCKDLKGEILKFTNNTAIDKANMETIVAECMATGGTLATNLAKKQKDLQYWQDQKREAEGRYEHDKIVAGTTVTYAPWFPPLSWIAAATVLGIYIAKAVAAKEDMETDDKMILKDKADIADALQIQTTVAAYTTEWQNCDVLANNAMEAVHKVEMGFSDMLDNLNDLSDDAGLLDGIANDPVSRALGELTEASAVWGHIQTVASNYKENCIINILGPEESKAFIQQVTAGVTLVAEPVSEVVVNPRGTEQPCGGTEQSSSGTEQPCGGTEQSSSGTEQTSSGTEQPCGALGKAGSVPQTIDNQFLIQQLGRILRDRRSFQPMDVHGSGQGSAEPGHQGTCQGDTCGSGCVYNLNRPWQELMVELNRINFANPAKSSMPLIFMRDSGLGLAQPAQRSLMPFAASAIMVSQPLYGSSCFEASDDQTVLCQVFVVQAGAAGPGCDKEASRASSRLEVGRKVGYIIFAPASPTGPPGFRESTKKIKLAMADATTNALYDRVTEDIAVFVPDDSTLNVIHNHGAYRRAPYLELSTELEALTKQAGHRLLFADICCDRLDYTDGATITLGDTVLSVFTRLCFPSYRGRLVLDCLNVQGLSIRLFTPGLPPGFSVEILNLAGVVSQAIPVAIGSGKKGVHLFKSAEKELIQVFAIERPEPEDLVLDDALDLSAPTVGYKNEQVYLISDLELLSNLIRLLRYQFLVATTWLVDKPDTALSILNWISSITAGSSRPAAVELYFRCSTLLSRVSISNSVTSFYTPSLDLSVCEKVLTSRLTAALAFESSYEAFCNADVTSSNFSKATNLALQKSQDVDAEYAFLFAESKRRYRDAQIGLQEARINSKVLSDDLPALGEAFKQGVKTWKMEKEIAASIEGILTCVELVTSIGATIASAGAIGAPAGGEAIKAANELKTVIELGDFLETFAALIDNLTKAIAYIEQMVAQADSFQDVNKSTEGENRPDPDTVNNPALVVAGWDTFRDKVNAMFGEIRTKEIKHAQEYQLALLEMANLGKAVVASQQAVAQTGDEYVRTEIALKTSRAESVRLGSSVAALATQAGLLAAFKARLFSKLVTARSWVFLDFQQYLAAYAYYFTLNDVVPFRLAPGKAAAQYAADAAALQGAVAQASVQLKGQIDDSIVFRTDDEDPDLNVFGPWWKQRLLEKRKVMFSIPTYDARFARYARVRLYRIRFYLEFQMPPAARNSVAVPSPQLGAHQVQTPDCGDVKGLGTQAKAPNYGGVRGPDDQAQTPDCGGAKGPVAAPAATTTGDSSKVITLRISLSPQVMDRGPRPDYKLKSFFLMDKIALDFAYYQGDDSRIKVDGVFVEADKCNGSKGGVGMRVLVMMVFGRFSFRGEVLILGRSISVEANLQVVSGPSLSNMVTTR
ncbi:hypothetical protein B0H66DRAFT_632715 [Apodospora peruviana]|uniref:Uncharacterized protein n=1 Tax=Apodospora peruviana TaxID=516989 RepID=A0AAE0LY48_9PEZI|nr:hypothetical protein B0H66DRAFT_632715 [Apodospora peruviana]